MLGGVESVEDVAQRWAIEAERVNAARAARGLALIELHDVDATVAAYVNHGRWVADCLCGGGLACWPDHPRAACFDCGAVYGVSFPSASTMTDAANALALRRPANQNWSPSAETPSDLLDEFRRRNALSDDALDAIAGIMGVG